MQLYESSGVASDGALIFVFFFVSSVSGVRTRGFPAPYNAMSRFFYLFLF